MSESKNHIDILQIGAHIGNTKNDPVYNLDLTDKKVILVEPIPYLYKILLHNYRVKHKNPNITMINVAISDKNGNIDMYTPSPDCPINDMPWFITQMSSTTKEHYINHKLLERYPELKLEKLSIPCITLNKLIEDFKITSIDTLIVDTEGHDYNILKAFYLNLVKPKKIIFEYTYMDGTEKIGANFNELITHFFLNGYKFVKKDHEDIHISLE